VTAAVDESPEPTDKEVSHYSITFSLDRGSYFRRTCPSCGRDFKTEADPSDLAYALQPAFREAGVEIGEVRSGENEDTVAQQASRLHCPYCGHADQASEMLTLVFSEYLKRYAMREVMLPQINKMFSGLEDTFNRPRTSSRGLFSIDIRFEHHDSILPPRPISGPEPPDMIVVETLCCGKRVKILDDWRDLVVCPYCGTQLALQ
jgi:uncharacterized Zn-finger protein